MPEQDSPKENILVIKLGALGDFIQSLGPMAAIRKHHPQAVITLLTTKPFVKMVEDCGYFDHVWVDERPKWHNPGGWLSLRQKLNAGYFSRVYDLQNNDRSCLYFKLFKPRPEWVGIAKGASHRNISPSRTAGLAFDGHKQTLSLAGINDVQIDDMTWIEGQDYTAFNIQKPYILFVPGCAPSRPEKRWPARYYGSLAKTLHEWGYTPVVIGTQDEEDAALEICEIFPGAVNLTGKTALFDIISLARDAAAAFGNDTGPMHMIAPTGCPSYVLFSRHSNPQRHAPLGPCVRTIQTEDLNDMLPEKVIANIDRDDFRA